MTKKNESGIQLGRLETMIMSVVWENGSATVQDVKDVLDSKRSLAYTTILTMMRKLEKKGYLCHALRDRAYVYSATITQEQVRHSMLGDLMERLFEDSPALLMTHLFEAKRIPQKEMQQIQDIIKQISQNKTLRSQDDE